METTVKPKQLDSASNDGPAANSVAVVGAGPAGLTAAVSLANAGARVTCVGPGLSGGTNQGDTRTSALMETSVRLLKANGVWDACLGRSAPLRAIRLIDDTGRLIRAPEVVFHASDLDLDAFGYNVPNSALVDALIEHVSTLNRLELVETRAVTRVAPKHDHVEFTLEDGQTKSARLVVGADGRRSVCRAAAAISVTDWTYRQSAIACNFDHSLPHESISNEFHRAAGPFTTVPLPGNASSLVWVERPEEAARLMDLDVDEFTRALEDRLQGVLGQVRAVSKRAVFPLSGLSVSRLADRRIALVGEAAHVIPPIGAQGLNLGFRDAAALADCVAKAIAAGQDIGGPDLMKAYSKARVADISSRTFAVDMLNRSVLIGLIPVQAMRGLGLQILASFPTLRKIVMQAGLAPENAMPSDLRTPV